MKNIIQILCFTAFILGGVFLTPNVMRAQTTILSEGFEAVTIPAGWTQTWEIGSTNWDFGVSGGFSGNPVTAHSGIYNTRFLSSSGAATMLITPEMNLGNSTSATLTFYHTQAYTGSDLDSLTVFYRTGSASSWVRLAGYQLSISSWAQEFITLPNITASYQVAFRGFSHNGNGVCIDDVTIMAIRPIPFLEPWDNGNFTFNNWTVSGGNWQVDNTSGNPLPAADFSGQLTVQNYDQWIETPTLSASNWAFACADVWLDFDLKLVDNNNTGNEKLFVEVDTNGVWTTRAQFKNLGSSDWSSQHIKIKPGVSGYFKIRFRANGVNSEDIMHWYIDNIHIYGTCRPPLDFSFWGGFLSWNPPDCQPIMDIIFDDGGWENGWRGLSTTPDMSYGNKFPVTWDGIILNAKVYFVDNGTGTNTPNLTIDIYNSAQSLVSTSDPFNVLAPDTWFDVPINNAPFNGEFYAMVHWYNIIGNSYWLACDENGPNVVLNIGYQKDGATWSTSWANYPCVFLIRITALVNGELKTITIDRSGNPVVESAVPPDPLSHIDMSGDSGDHSVMGFRNVSDSGTLIGYNVWRTDSTGTSPFSLLTPVPISQNYYSDSLPPFPLYWYCYLYYVESVFGDPGNPGTYLCTSQSDTLNVFWIGVNDLNAGNISIFPNPATDFVNVTSSVKINSVEVLNFTGQTVYSDNEVNSSDARVDVQGLSSGVYFIKVNTFSGTRTTKITITR